jgi:hypothetical protein
MKTIWITLAVLVMVGIVLFRHHRRRAAQNRTDVTETGGEIPVDVEISLENLGGLGSFLSEQNALSHDQTF